MTLTTLIGVAASFPPLGPGARAAPLRLMLLGDSLTAGYGLPRTDAFPAQLDRALAEGGLHVTVIDAGVSGDTSAGGRARLPWLLGSKAEEQPDAVIVALGGNDMLRGFDPAATEANLAAILGELRGRGMPALLAGMRAPPNLGADYQRQFDAVYPRLAQQSGAVFYPFFLEGVAAQPSLNQPDGIHPNAAGVAEMVRRILPSVQSLLSRAAPPEARR